MSAGGSSHKHSVQRARPSLGSRRVVVGTAVVLVLCLLGLRILLWPIHTTDLEIAFLPWQAKLIEHGRFLALKHPVGDYFPAYFEMATLTSLLDPHLSRISQVKLVAYCFDLLSAMAAYAIARVLQAGRRPGLENVSPAVLASFAVLAGPTVIVNSAIMGQQDVDFTFFLLLTVLCVLVGRSAMAPLCFGLALAFKLQAVFLAPFLLAMIFCRRIRFWSLLLIPVGWSLALIPPVMAGGSVREYVTLPFTQMSEVPALAVNIGNPWAIANFLHFPLRLGVLLGLAISGVAGLAVAALGLRKEAGSLRGIAAVATVSLLTMPYVMPKMHDRYFFPAELLLSILACVDLTFLLPAGLVIAASLISYAGYFTEYAHHPWTALALVANTAALYIAVRYAVEITKQSNEDAVEQPPPVLPSLV